MHFLPYEWFFFVQLSQISRRLYYDQVSTISISIKVAYFGLPLFIQIKIKN